MGIKLPATFIEEMERLLQEDAESFFASYDEPRQSGLRANGLKLTGDELRKMTPLTGEAIPWADGGYYTTEDDRPGKHPFYYLGLYYVQEPSAMLPAELLGVRPGHRVIDLCAAPGGKTTQLAAKLQGQGVLVTNDNAAERTKALAKNVEMAGVRNAVVLNEEPGRIADAFGDWFDRVLVDAPCSGEGMFRKDEDMVRQWERHSVERCSGMQRDILRDAARLVAPGGRLLYSTCTFSPRENEGTIARFLAEHPEFEVVPVAAPSEYGFAPGRPDWLREVETAGLDKSRTDSLAGTVRVWPHRSRGEGHYAALLMRRGAESEPEADIRDGLTLDPLNPLSLNRGDNGISVQVERRSLNRGDSGISVQVDHRSLNEGDNGTSRQQGGGFLNCLPISPQVKPASKGRQSSSAKRPVMVNETDDTLQKLAAFLQDHMCDGQHHPAFRSDARIIVRGSSVYLVPEQLASLKGLNVVRPGWLLGSATKHRFEPSQAFAMGIAAEDAARSLRLSSGHPDSLRYLKGETLQPPGSDIVGPDGNTPVSGKGWVLVCIDGFPAGWGRWDGALLKNERLPGWRWV